MKKLITTILLVLTTSLFPQQDANKTLSPYFVIIGEEEHLPLLSTSAEVDIAGVIADVRVNQVYKNDGKKPIEAIYVFPASTRAAVYGMKMTIGERTIIANIEEREKARKDYEDAKANGQSASLLEQQRPNVFQMNVANIMPGDRIKVELLYTELLIPDEGTYSFIYPTVVGPRYSETPAENANSKEGWVQNPYLKEGEDAPYSFDIDVNIFAGLPISQITCSSHKTDISYDGKDFASVALSNAEKSGGNRDFVLKYQLQGGQIESGVLLFEEENENFFLMMVQPPKRVTEEEIPPREYVFIVDVSGSMHGFPLDISKELMKNLLGKMRSQDMFNVLLFANGNTVMSPYSLPATSKNIEKAMNIIDSQHGGGTQLLPALQEALKLPQESGNSRTMVIVTDGYVSVEKQAFELIRNNLDKSNFFAFGIGSSVNRYIIEGMAHVGNGEPFIILNSQGAKEKAEKFRKYIEKPVLTDIDIRFSGFQAYDVEPYKVSDLLAERPILVYGKYTGNASGKIIVTGKGGKNDFKKEFNISDFETKKENSAIKYLWARQRIRLLGDFASVGDGDVKEEITELGLKYSLLTEYTSFIAIDSEIRNTTGEQTTVKQPLPLPQGVSNYAIGKGGRAMKCAPSMQMNTLCEDVASSPDAIEIKKKEDVIAKVIIKNIISAGPHTEQEIENFVKSLSDKFSACINSSGGIVIEFTINAKGFIDNLKIISKSLSKAEAQCIQKALKNARYPDRKPEATVARITLEF